MRSIRFKCKKCGGPKFIGEQYYAFGTYYVDITCVICAHSKDIEVAELKKLLKKLYGYDKVTGNDNEKTSS